MFFLPKGHWKKKSPAGRACTCSPICLSLQSQLKALHERLLFCWHLEALLQLGQN